MSIAKNDYPNAYKYLSMAADIAHDNYQIQKNAGTLAMLNNNYSAAQKYFNNAKSIAIMEDTNIAISLALCYIYSGDSRNALLELNSAAGIEKNTKLGDAIDSLTLEMISGLKSAKKSGSSFDEFMHSHEIASKLSELLLLCTPPKIYEAAKWKVIASKQ